MRLRESSGGMAEDIEAMLWRTWRRTEDAGDHTLLYYLAGEMGVYFTLCLSTSSPSCGSALQFCPELLYQISSLLD